MNIFGVGTVEIVVILVVILVLFGPDKLPELAKKIGGASREIRDNLNSFNDQMNGALETSMEIDKARGTPPVETAPTENKIMRDDAARDLPPPMTDASETSASPPPPAPASPP